MGKIAGSIGIAGGVCLTLGGFTGHTMLQIIKDFVDKYLPENIGSPIGTLLSVLIFIALLGGIAVIIGGYLIYRDVERIGKIFIILGLGVGITSVIVEAIVAYLTKNMEGFIVASTTMKGLGIILGAIARAIT